MKQLPGQQFRELLRNELRRRSEINANYSLRSFARSIGISPSGLSMVMSGKKPVTLNFVEKVTRGLKLDSATLQNHQMNLLNEKSLMNGELSEYQFIDEDTLSVIKEWYHYAILNLMRTKDFKPSASWVAKRLGITLGEVQSAIERLEKVGILKVQKDKWIDLSNKFTSHTNNSKASDAARENQKQIFAKASSAIENVDFKNRNHTGVTLAIAMKDLDKAKVFISEFRKRFMKIFDNENRADEVYQLSVALFPLTNLKDGGSNE